MSMPEQQQTTDAQAWKQSGEQPREAWFGEEKVAWAEKQYRVRGVFDSVAENYDLMNDLMSGGIHRLWKATFVDMLAPRPGMHLLDVAGGTGDIAFRFLDRLTPKPAEGEIQTGAPRPNGRVTVCDINENMLRVGRDRSLDKGYLHGLEWVTGNAECLPFENSTLDAYTIAFGLRNVTDIPRALREAKRVLKPGGRFMCLEFSRVVIPGLDQAYDMWSDHVLPRLGEYVARDRASYVYLVESIRRFPPQEQLVAMMQDAGLERCSYRNLSGGIAAIHSGWKI